MAGYDRGTGEPPKAFAHFTIYRDLGRDRSLSKLAQLCGISVSRCQQLSDKYDWVSRCDQWDAHVLAIHDRSFLTETAKRGRQRAQLAHALMLKAAEALKHLDVSAGKVKLAEVAAAIKVACELQRLEDGLDTARISMEVTDARTIIAQYPADIRREVLLLLEGDPAPASDPGAAGTVPALAAHAGE